ncbi:UDP-glucose--hexose-1-phosphate uridylyltransferase [Paenibacillus dendritiformis]|uniref:UDP-glucose--hexose-1-phosphate uridylyltransferase n=1 Tax=Paenibacillus dendritiformis TaxID=130049 RepID=UPI00387E0932
MANEQRAGTAASEQPVGERTAVWPEASTRPDGLRTAARPDAARTAELIEKLIRYARNRNMIGTLDMPYARNQLLELFRLDEPCEGYLAPEWSDVPDEPQKLLEALLDEAAASGLLPDNTTTWRDLLDAKVMGLLMPRPSETEARFRTLWAEQGIAAATDEFYALNKDSNYIRMDRIRKNEYWLHPSEFGEMEMTINLSKPEKTPQEIAQAGQAAKADYPQCLLCADNVGYAGRVNHPARQNLRIIPLELNGEAWFFQYSPYVYYNEHSIVFRREHVPMKLTRDTFARLLAFTEQFPHYFIGSNADLPIVGGSILSHDHFQAGRHTFPIEKAPTGQAHVHAAHPGVRVGVVDWPMSVLRLTADEREALLNAADDLYRFWQGYSDEQAGILACSESPGGQTRHNTVTPIVRRRGDRYEMDLVLRNNRMDEAHPEGIFHPHRHLHHIKKENIGLIEVMGLAILPGRLLAETGAIARLLAGQKDWEAARASFTEQDPLKPHAAWIDELVERYGTRLEEAEANRVIRHDIGSKFVEILGHAGVFKRDREGREACARFLARAGFKAQG